MPEAGGLLVGVVKKETCELSPRSLGCIDMNSQGQKSPDINIFYSDFVA